MNSYSDLTKKMNEQLINANQDKINIWKEYVLFDWHWWFGVLLAIVPIILWIKFRDKNLTVVLLLAGLTSAILSAYFDTTFLFFGLFDYRYEVTPMGPNYLPWNFCFIPVLIMFTVQLFSKINIYLKGVILSALVSFIGLPILSWMRIFNLINWNYFYSFIVFFTIFSLSYQMSKIAKFITK
ncbi:CBO0543 family protein [Virgibacillus ndiopensis]|uniref:CBO0543 family protein n=1 Tax=Virgibacillus ndiopensis TaxID=2004408 RepID=UPI000C07E1A5|nr:CBO0543 family protein [Virgibacillus ndiopensis]